MAVDSVSIAEIKVLADNYNVILKQYIAANKSLSDLGVYEVLSNKKISGGTSSYSGVMPTVEACQTKCVDLNCSIAAYNSVTRGCEINNTGNVIDGSLSEKVIINRQIYYLNQLDNLNTQLSTINTQIIAKINAINNGTTLASLRDERVRLNAKLQVDKVALTNQMANTTNFMKDSDILDLEYIRQDEELETNSHYYIFLLLLLISIIALIVLISMQT
jgi:hypothetical protein